MELLSSHGNTLESFAVTKTGVNLSEFVEKERPKLINWWSELLESIAPMVFVRYDGIHAPRAALTPYARGTIATLKAADLLAENLGVAILGSLEEKPQFEKENLFFQEIAENPEMASYRIPLLDDIFK